MLAPLLAAFVASQTPIIGIVDFYGLRSITEERARAALGLKEGDSLPDEIDGARRRLEALPGVRRADFGVVCCQDGRYILYVGIAERGAPTLTFAPPPHGRARLPDAVVGAAAAFDSAFDAALEAGDFAEDQSRGYALSHFPRLRAVQERFPALADRYGRDVRAVLHESEDGSQRATAARVLGYASDRQAVVADLVAAISDSVEDVRNNAMRALWVLAQYAKHAADHRPLVPGRPFVALLNSPVWTDRNKASLALGQLTESRDSALLAAIRAGAMPALLDMARWKSAGHAWSALLILGRAVGMAEGEIQAAFQRGDRGPVLHAAERALPRRR